MAPSATPQPRTSASRPLHARDQAPSTQVSTTRPTLRPSPAPSRALPASGKIRSARSKASGREGQQLQAQRSNYRPCPKYPCGRPGRRCTRRSDPCRYEVARLARESSGLEGEHECLARNSSGIAFKTREVRAWGFWGCEYASAPWFPLRWIPRVAVCDLKMWGPTHPLLGAQLQTNSGCPKGHPGPGFWSNASSCAGKGRCGIRTVGCNVEGPLPAKSGHWTTTPAMKTPAGTSIGAPVSIECRREKGTSQAPSLSHQS
jgi:hypothetical protein